MIFAKLGLGNGGAKNTTVMVPMLTANNVVNFCAGQEFTCVVSDDGRVACTGANAEGQLGNGDRNERNLLTSVSNLAADVSKVVCGYVHACVLTTRGHWYCWGDNAYGQVKKSNLRFFDF